MGRGLVGGRVFAPAQMALLLLGAVIGGATVEGRVRESGWQGRSAAGERPHPCPLALSPMRWGEGTLPKPGPLFPFPVTWGRC